VATSFYDEIDQLVKNGKLTQAKDALRKSRQRKFPSNEIGKICLLARRCGLPELALRWLSPIVRPQGRTKSVATPDHLVEYAGALIHLGGVLEGMQIIDDVKEPLPPRAHLYWAFGCFARWEYAKSIPRLEAYIRHPEVSDYDRAMGKANLAAALAYERDPKAHDFLVEVIAELKEKKYDRLRLNVQMSLADLSASNNAFEEGRSTLREAEASLGGGSSYDSLFLAKWFAVLDLREGIRGAEKKLQAVRAKALELKHWETIRNIDYHLVMKKHDRDRLARLYFGTPYPMLREKILRDFVEAWSPPDTYEWIPDGAKPTSKLLDFSNSLELEAKFSQFKAGHLGARLVSVLVSDLYRPFNIGAIFGHLFPDEYYNYVSSPARLHQLVKRTRDATKRLGLVISEAEGLYSLATSKVRLRIPREVFLVPRAQSMMAQLRTLFPEEAVFSAEQAAKALDANYWTVVKWIRSAVAEGKLEKQGAARATRYRFSQAVKSQSKSA